MSEREHEKKDVIVIKPSYIETPKGKIPTYEFVRGLVKAIDILDDAASNLEEKLARIEKTRAPNLDELRERLSTLEESIKELQERLDFELKDVSDKLSVLTDAFAELVERIKKIEESLPRD